MHSQRRDGGKDKERMDNTSQTSYDGAERRQQKHPLPVPALQHRFPPAFFSPSLSVLASTSVDLPPSYPSSQKWSSSARRQEHAASSARPCFYPVVSRRRAKLDFLLLYLAHLLQQRPLHHFECHRLERRLCRERHHQQQRTKHNLRLVDSPDCKRNERNGTDT
jgi:hypothetical protein